MVASFAEECERLLARLEVSELRRVALMKMERYTNEEIAGRFGRTTRYVERKLHTIRAIWADEGGP